MVVGYKFEMDSENEENYDSDDEWLFNSIQRMDLLDSIMSKMDRPPVIDTQERRLIKQQQKAMEVAKAKERDVLKKFRKKIEEEIDAFFQDGTQMKKVFEPMDRVFRSIIRDVADVAGLTAYVFGVEEEDRHVMVFKKEYPLADEELTAYRNGLEWDPVQAKKEALEKEQRLKEEKERAEKLRKEPGSTKFLEKYERLVGKETGLEAARIIEADDNKQFGFVRSELKKDKRTIEETLADIRAKKQKKNDGEPKDST